MITPASERSLLGRPARNRALITSTAVGGVGEGGATGGGAGWRAGGGTEGGGAVGGGLSGGGTRGGGDSGQGELGVAGMFDRGSVDGASCEAGTATGESFDESGAIGTDMIRRVSGPDESRMSSAAAPIRHMPTQHRALARQRSGVRPAVSPVSSVLSVCH